METAISTISILPENKEQLERFTKMLKSEILDEVADPLETLVRLTVLEKLIKNLLTDKDISYKLVLEAEKLGGQTVKGASLKVQETGVKYDYAGCGDPTWDYLNERITALTEERKERENMLKNIPAGSTLADTETGAVIYRPAKRSTTKVVVRL